MIKVLVRKRLQGNKLMDKVILVEKEDGLDFYEIVAKKLGWKGNEDALWYLARTNYILVEKLDEDVKQWWGK